jgi:two-component system nitrate/nitrite sensor histidine kinase NarX
LLGLSGILIAIGAVAFSFSGHPAHGPWMQAQLVLLLLAAGFIVVILVRIRRELLEPLSYLRHWAWYMRRGDLEVRLPAHTGGEFDLLARDINALSEALQRSARTMDRQVHQQTERLAEKTRSLEILYDVAANLNTACDLDDLLTRFLHSLKDIMGARAAMVRLRTGSDQMRLVASIGIDADIVERERLVPLQRCMCGHAILESTVLCQSDSRRCAGVIGRHFFPVDTPQIEMVAVPLQYREQTLGVYNLFVDASVISERQDLKDLLISIGRHLGLALEKARLDAESKRLSIMQERALLAHELHDSLAQTLVSLRLQVKMLRETLENATHRSSPLEEVGQIQHGMEQAHVQLRELLVHFRTPMDERGLVPALEESIARFSAETGIAVFFQQECDELALAPEVEIQVLHIVQEALANIRKHSHAETVRVLVRCDQIGSYRVVVEDDGVGLSDPAHALPGEHVGLAIMQERASRVNGEITVDSEPGEGTRLVLTFRYKQPLSIPGWQS